ncbi:MAG: radical SAM protein [Planctomycetaceae bacterium]|jgi:organic radical activating enzyme|nr:radical SAM protein [Planctomycetaceae bacterium]
MFYKNGNTAVILCSDGTKIRYIPDDELPQPVRPESIDIKITNYCRNNCWFCYEHSNPNGQHGNLNHPILETLEAGTELAIGGGNPLAHPQLESFLSRMRSKKVVCNLTIHQKDYVKNKQYIDEIVLHRFVNGLGISVGDIDDNLQIHDDIRKRVVVHTIIGITPVSVIQKISQRYKVLLLGNKNQQPDIAIINEIRNYITNCGDMVEALYFDNLACEQLDVRSLIDDNTWKSRYMGDDGMFTMFIDLIQECGYVSSVDKDIGVSLSESSTIRDVFSKIRQSINRV